MNNVSDWISLAGAIVAGIALGVSVVAAFFAKRQADAADEANRINRAMLDVARQQLKASSSDESERFPYVPPWKVEHVTGDLFALTNGGSSEERDVTIVPPLQSAVGSSLHFDRIEAMSTRTFMIVLTEASPNRNLTVTWNHDGIPETWQTVLPPRS